MTCFNRQLGLLRAKKRRKHQKQREKIPLDSENGQDRLQRDGSAGKTSESKDSQVNPTRSVPRPGKRLLLGPKANLDQLFDYLIVLDFEATCWGSPEEQQGHAQEISQCCLHDTASTYMVIVELPAVLLNLATHEVEETFHSYVQPVHDQQLSKFCMSLTGISQVCNLVLVHSLTWYSDKWILQSPSREFLADLKGGCVKFAGKRQDSRLYPPLSVIMNAGNYYVGKGGSGVRA